jgi:DNA-binding transcriptional LysR family regulator
LVKSPALNVGIGLFKVNSPIVGLLRVFVEVARHLSLCAQPRALHLTPPAVTMQVKELESAIELPLFDREGRKVSLTTAGEYFLVYAKRMLSTLKDADDAMARFRKLESGLLSVGMVGTAKYFVPHLLTRFREEHPGVELQPARGQQPRRTGGDAAAG